MVFTLGQDGGAIGHKSSKQNMVSRSSCESEIHAMDAAVVHIEWLRQLLKDLGYEQASPSTVHQDNQSSIHIIQSGEYKARTRHYNWRYHYVKQAMEHHTICLRYLPSANHPADLLTKAMTSSGQFFKLRALLLCCVNSPSGL